MNPMTPSEIRAFRWFSSKILSISDSMVEAVVDLTLKTLNLMGVANFSKYENYVKSWLS